MFGGDRSVVFSLDCGLFAVQSLLDDYGLTDVSAAAEAVKEAVQQEQFQKATELWSVAETVVEQVGTRGTRSSLFHTRGDIYSIYQYGSHILLYYI